MFFVSVASKGLEFRVSDLESTLTGISISVDSKGAYVAPKLCKEWAFLRCFSWRVLQGSEPNKVWTPFRVDEARELASRRVVGRHRKLRCGSNCKEGLRSRGELLHAANIRCQ